MRPVTIGDRPTNSAGQPIDFKEYGEARPYLVERVGEYCVFCERKIPTSLAVEHKKPKALPQYAHLKLEWSNFVLACTNCNGIKGDINTGEDPRTGKVRYLFPDECNTARAFLYTDNNHISPNPELVAEELAAAERTLVLVGLDRLDLHLGLQSRWHQRARLWEKAKRRRSLVDAANTEKSWQDVLDIAEESGFWSVWMAVFHDHPQVRQLLIDRFPNTNTSHVTDSAA